MQTYDLTYFKNAKEGQGQALQATFEQLQKLLTSFSAREAKDGPGLVFARTQGNTRKNTDILNCTCLGLDFDDLDSIEQRDQVFNALSDYFFIYHTTHSHSTEQIKFRIILPFEAPLPASAFSGLWDHIYQALPYKPDTAARNNSRFFYLPSHNPENSTIAEALINQGGKLLSPESFTPNPNAAPTTSLDRFDTIFDGGLPATTKKPARAQPDKPSIETAIKNHVKKLQRSKSERNRIDASLWEKVLQGQPYADTGVRVTTSVALTYQLARLFPTTNAGLLSEIFLASVQAMQTTETQDNPAPTKANIEGMIVSAQAKVQDERSRNYSKAQRAKSRKIQAARLDMKDTAYSPEEIDAIALAQQCTPEDLNQQWLVYNNGAIYFLTIDGYCGPYKIGKETRVLCELFLLPAGIEITEWNENSQKFFLWPLDEILRQHGILARNIIADLTIQYSRYDKNTQVIYEATAKRSANLTPAPHKVVLEWLTHLAGQEQISKLLDWLAICPQLDKLACGLYLYGPSGAGKTLMAQGLAQLWGDGTATDMNEVFGAFNDRMSRNPLILADEYIPQRQGESITGKIRQIIGSKGMIVRRKFLPASEMKGAVRLMFTSNESLLFEFDEAIGKLGQEALAKRILYINALPDSVDYLQALSNPDRDWIMEKGLAEFCLWLAETRKVTPGKRLFVEGDIGPMIRKLNIANKPIGAVCEWIIRYLQNPKKLQMSSADTLVLSEDGIIYINNQALADHWGKYHNNEKQLTTNTIGKTLAALSEKQATKRVNGRRRRFWQIDTENLIEWAEENNYALKDEIIDLIKGAEYETK